MSYSLVITILDIPLNTQGQMPKDCYQSGNHCHNGQWKEVIYQH